MSMQKIRYLIEKPSGFYYQPGKNARALGIEPEELGTDRSAAIDRAQELNRQLDKERALIKEGKTRPPYIEGSFKHLFIIWRGDEGLGIEPMPEWSRLAQSTKDDYDGFIDGIFIPKWGDDPVSALDVEIAEALRNTKKETPHRANNMMSCLASAIKVAIRKKSIFGISTNPVKDVPKFGTKDGVVPRQVQWEDEQEEQFIDLADDIDPEIALGYDLLVYTGQRLQDVLDMDTTDYDGEKIAVVQQKTGRKVWIPCHRVLKERLDKHLADRASNDNRIGGTLLQTVTGCKFIKRNFAKRWDAIMEKAGLKGTGLQRRDLRRTAVTRMADAGVGDIDISAVTGHSLDQVKKILETYLVRTYRQAQRAITKLELDRPTRTKKKQKSENDV